MTIKSDSTKPLFLSSWRLIVILGLLIAGCGTPPSTDWTKERKKANKNLLKAVETGDTLEVRQALRGGANPNVRAKGSWGPSALDIAAERGHTETVKILLQKGADALDNDLVPVAIASGDIEILRLLLERGICPSSTALFDDAANSPDILKVLIDFGDNCPLWYKNKVLKQAMLMNDTASIVSLLSKGADPCEALEEAVDNGHIQVLQELLSLGVDPNAPCHVKISTGSDSWEIGGGSLLARAVVVGSVDMVKLLLENGANATPPATPGYSPMALALGSEHGELIDLLREAGSNIDAPFQIMTRKEMGLGIREGEFARPREWAVPVFGTALHKAAYEGKTERVRTLLSQGSDPDAMSSDSVTALGYAILGGSLNIVRELLNAGSIVNHRFILQRKDGVEEKPLASGLVMLSTYSESNAGTALHLAVIGRRADIIEELMLAGADLSATDGEGRTALDLARALGEAEIVALLKGEE